MLFSSPSEHPRLRSGTKQNVTEVISRLQHVSMYSTSIVLRIRRFREETSGKAANQNVWVSGYHARVNVEYSSSSPISSFYAPCLFYIGAGRLGMRGNGIALPVRFDAYRFRCRGYAMCLSFSLTPNSSARCRYSLADDICRTRETMLLWAQYVVSLVSSNVEKASCVTNNQPLQLPCDAISGAENTYNAVHV